MIEPKVKLSLIAIPAFEINQPTPLSNQNRHLQYLLVSQQRIPMHGVGGSHYYSNSLLHLLSGDIR
jgi:hypothetical protein